MRMIDDVELDGLLAEASALQPRTIALRRSLHRHPEVGDGVEDGPLGARQLEPDLGVAVRTGAGVALRQLGRRA